MIVASSSASAVISSANRNSQDILQTIELSREELQPRGTRFIVARMGGTGSAWLAKLLNSHPDVFCSHEAVAARAFPAKQYSGEDIFLFLRWLAWDTMHEAYAAIGDVGSVWQSHAVAVPGFRTALLIRHPARVLASRLATYPNDQSFTDIWTQDAIREIWDIDISRFDPLDQVFLNDLYIFAAHLWGLQRGIRIIRIEDLARPQDCHNAAKYLTGLEYPAQIIDEAIKRPVNQRVKPAPIQQIVSGFTARQREWYRLILRDVAPEFGYEL